MPDYIPDMIDLYNEHDVRQQTRLAKLPKCCCCDEPIQQENAVRINWKFYCDDCLDDMRVSIGDD